MTDKAQCASHVASHLVSQRVSKDETRSTDGGSHDPPTPLTPITPVVGVNTPSFFASLVGGEGLLREGECHIKLWGFLGNLYRLADIMIFSFNER